ncbi:MAG: hypothetical protein ACQGVC_25010 [Myxococcota bacterium]
MQQRILVVFTTLLALGFAGAAGAAPIGMNPGSVTLSTVLGQGNDFTLAFDGGDTSDNILDFTVHGGGGTGFMGAMPSAAIAAIVFDGTSIIDSGDTVGGLLNPSNVVRGLAIPGTGTAAALFVDNFGPSSESFFLQLSSVPTTATIYSLNVGNVDVGDIKGLDDILNNAIDKVGVRFDSAVAAIPEPSAALVFGIGLLVTRSAIRRQR